MGGYLYYSKKQKSFMRWVNSLSRWLTMFRLIPLYWCSSLVSNQLSSHHHMYTIHLFLLPTGFHIAHISRPISPIKHSSHSLLPGQWRNAWKQAHIPSKRWTEMKKFQKCLPAKSSSFICFQNYPARPDGRTSWGWGICLPPAEAGQVSSLAPRDH